MSQINLSLFKHDVFIFKGDGTRAGKGKCSCSSGYSGDLCDKCASGYYEEAKNETFVKCTGK